MISRILIAAWGLFALATGLASMFLLGNLAIASAFAVVGAWKITQKKWIPGVVCILQCASAAMFLYYYVAGLPWNQWLPEPWGTIVWIGLSTLVIFLIGIYLVRKEKKKAAGSKNTGKTKGRVKGGTSNTGGP